MKVLLVVANGRAQAEPCLGVGYLAGYLREYAGVGVDVRLLNYMPRDVSKVVGFSPDVVGFSAITRQYPSAVSYAKKVKEELDVPVVVGGPHVSIAPESFDPAFDVAVLGEGEQTFLELVEYLDGHGLDKEGLRGIDGLMFFDGAGRRVVTRERRLIEPLDRIPYPARDLYNMDFILNERKNVFGLSFGRGTQMFTSRGCPFKCVFCSASFFWRKVRYNSPEYVVGEMNELIEKYGVKLVHIYDDLFIANKERLRKIVELVEAERINEKVEFGMFGRVDVFDSETADLLRRMNTVFVEFGIESGSQRVLDFLKCGQIKLPQAEKAVALCRRNGIKVGGTFIIGNPGETEAEMLQTLDFIRKLKLDKFAFSTLNPFPGTPLWEYAKAEGLLPEKIDWGSYELRKARGLTEEDVVNGSGQIMIDKSVSPKRFVEIFNMFEEERRRLFDYRWEEAIPAEEPGL